jgi:hypothetical protein
MTGLHPRVIGDDAMSLDRPLGVLAVGVAAIALVLWLAVIAAGLIG